MLRMLLSGTSRVKLFPMIKQLVVLSHTYALFGAGLSEYSLDILY